MRFSYVRVESLASLAWGAICNADSETVTVVHGRYVETRPTFFFEGAWSGSFGDGAPDESDAVFGTGGVVAHRCVTFVNCTATTDRLHLRDHAGRLTISNSLPLLLALLADAACDGSTAYRAANAALLEGLDNPDYALPTANGHVRRILHCNVRFAHGATHIVDKRPPPRFASYTEYRSYLADRLHRLLTNARDPTRSMPMSVCSTQSSGYDTTAVNALAASFAVDKVFTSPQSKEPRTFWMGESGGQPSDDGTPICAALRLPCVSIDRLAFRNDPAGEHWYWAGLDNNQDFNLHDIRRHLERPTLLLTGNHGMIWYTKRSAGPHRLSWLNGRLRCWDPSGLGLSEVRLEAGFVPAAVPYLGARSVEDVLRITESDEMAPWRLANDYDRPIPRRIAEEAGVPRELFGQRKLASIVHPPTPNVPLSDALRAEFLAHLRRRGLLDPFRARLLPLVQRLNNWIYWRNPSAWFANRPAHPLLWRIGYYWNRVFGSPLRIRMAWTRIDSFLFAFCVNKVRDEYATALTTALSGSDSHASAPGLDAQAPRRLRFADADLDAR